ncbi:MAG TPA: hypothetical protein VFG89_03895 [Coriobacteriia bacterium]|nr:hypothetical protein [Coriobacteriia bacterium]
MLLHKGKSRSSTVLFVAVLAVAILAGVGTAYGLSKSPTPVVCSEGSRLGMTMYYTKGSTGVDTITQVVAAQTGGAKKYRRLRCKVGDADGYKYDNSTGIISTTAMSKTWSPGTKVSHGNGFVVVYAYTGTSSTSATTLIGGIEAHTYP